MQPFPTPTSNRLIDVSNEIRNRRISCGDVLVRCLEQIEQQESHLKAWVVVDADRAKEAARQLDAELEQGQWRGPLHGVPVGVKDIFDVAGLPTMAGSSRRRNTVAEHDAVLVSRLRDAGAVILGKTVTTQFACFDPPHTRNPWNPDRTPGGSSSGSAAAVSTEMCYAALGSQTGGSITRPAAYCGVCGLKPTYRQLPLSGCVPVAESLDHAGPLTRCIADLALMQDALDGRKRYAQAIEANSLERLQHLRIGVTEELFADRPTMQSCDPDSQRLLRRLQRRLGKNLCSTNQISLPIDFDEILSYHRTLMSYEAAAWHRWRFEQHPEDYLPNMTSLIREGLETTPTEYQAARHQQRRWRQRMKAEFARYDVLVCPATTGPAPDRSTTGDSSMNAPWSFLGLPTVSLPVALTNDELPLSLQFVGRRRNERTLLALAHHLETRFRRDSLAG
ncbi:amidase [Thalassoroseus pseudoceratinae]|uniref:amidase n=1 Tax=Thalassoroseus pseudoceratinae TaxID=2713176 RepID=UPI001422AC10|nr:amidase [Thalassoroseus pseudoceratinae]